MARHFNTRLRQAAGSRPECCTDQRWGRSPPTRLSPQLPALALRSPVLPHRGLARGRSYRPILLEWGILIQSATSSMHQSRARKSRGGSSKRTMKPIATWK